MMAKVSMELTENLPSKCARKGSLETQSLTTQDDITAHHSTANCINV